MGSSGIRSKASAVIGVMRFPCRSFSSSQLQTIAGTITNAGLVPLAILTATNQNNALAQVNALKGMVTYFEFGNEGNYALGWSGGTYAIHWSNDVPVLRAAAPGAKFGGPVGSDFDHNGSAYLTNFLNGIKGNANLTPDFISMHYYSAHGEIPAWTSSQILSDVTNQMTPGVAALQSEISSIMGSAIPLAITEWNYDAVPENNTNTLDTNSTFMTAYTFAMLNMFNSGGVWMACQYDFAAGAGSGHLDMVSTSGTTKPQYVVFTNWQNQYGGSVAPSITTQPQSQAVAQGNNAVFSVTAAGSALLTYQWHFNGTNISGVTGTSYTKTNVQSADAGNYSVVVTNTVGSITSSNATLIVLAPSAGLTNLDIGAGAGTFNASYASTVNCSNGTWQVQASGAGGTNGPQDGMNYIYQPQSGDFDVAVRVENITGSDARARAGLVMREDLTPGSREYLITAGPAATNAADGSGIGYNGVETLERTTVNTALISFPNSPNPPVLGNYGGGVTNLYPVWLRMRKSGTNIYVYTGADGTNWYLSARDDAIPANWPASFYVGLMTTANNLTNYTQAQFSHYGNYTVSGHLQVLLVSGGNSGSGGLSGLVNGGSTGSPSALDTPAGAPNAPGVWQPSASYLYNLLTTNFGYAVTVVHGNTARTEDANGMALIIWGGTCYSSDVGSKFEGVAVPAVFWKASSLEKNYYISTSANRGNDSGQTTIQIVNTNNPIVQGLFGLNSSVTVSSSAQYFGYGISNDLADAGNGFTIVAVNPGTPTHVMLYYADVGAALYSNSVTNKQPARRVGLWLGDNTSPIGDWSQIISGGFALLINAINWAVFGTNVPVVITTQPQSQSVPAGAAATFSVTVTNTATFPINYQWWEVAPGISTNLINGATNSSYTTPALSLADNDEQYYVVVTNVVSLVNSSMATLTVTDPPDFVAVYFDNRNLTMIWTNRSTLLTATNLALPVWQWTVMTGVTSPYVVSNLNVPQQFYRVKQ